MARATVKKSNVTVREVSSIVVNDEDWGGEFSVSIDREEPVTIRVQAECGNETNLSVDGAIALAEAVLKVAKQGR